MGKRFAGTHRHKVEERGRVSLPAVFRKVLKDLGSSDLYLVPCMKRADAHVVMTEAGFDAFCARVEATLTTPADREAFNEFVQGRAVPLEADEAGRIVLSAPIRQMLGIAKELVFVGLGHVFEIRAPDAHDARAEAVDVQARRLIADTALTDLH
ncbi:MAG: hypothetical protein AAF675_21080 [Pseudomonadota bacterium]